jgi:hypothetical protein
VAPVSIFGHQDLSAALAKRRRIVKICLIQC